jgi:hypothetical protein
VNKKRDIEALSNMLALRFGELMNKEGMGPVDMIHCSAVLLANCCAASVIFSRLRGDVKDEAFVEQLIELLATQLREDIIRKAAALGGFKKL